MRIGFRKVWRDLWQHRGRTLLVVLSIAVGVAALGLTMGSNAMMNEYIDASRAARNSPEVFMNLETPFDDDVLEAIENLEEVDQAEGATIFNVRWKPAQDADWQDATLIAVKDFSTQRFDLVQLRDGVWPEDGTVAVEFNHAPYYDMPPVGGIIIFKGANGQPVPLTLTGTLRDPSQSPPPFNIFNKPAFYVNLDGLEALTGNRFYTQLRFDVPVYSEEAAREAGKIVDERLVDLGIKSAVQVLSIDITDPSKGRAQEFVDGLGLILVTMASMSLGLSIFLVINTINAIIINQVRQIGMMKIVGGVRRQIALLYLSGVFAYGFLSLLIAVPLGMIGGNLLARGLLFSINIQITNFELVPETILTQIGVGLMIPLGAALWPVVYGTAIPAREAISAYGLGRGVYGTRRMDRFLSSLRALPRLASLSLRNTFRRPGRLILTEITLVGAGTIFMMVVTTGYSFNQTIDRVWDAWGYDVLMIFDGFQRSEEITAATGNFPGVEDVEMWVWMDATAHLPGKDDPGDRFKISMRGVPEDSQQFDRILLAGRTLLPNDGHTMVLNQSLALDMGAGIGDPIIVDLPGGKDAAWTVVGLVSDVGAGGTQDTAFVHRAVLSADLNRAGQATVAQIRTEEDTRASQDQVKDVLQNHFDQQGIGIGFAMGQLENKELAGALWDVIGGLLQMMAVLMAIVGSIGLSGTLSINVIERSREIGVMRAVGASSFDVARIFIGEGLLLGVLSWAGAVPLSMLVAKAFVDALGEILQFPFSYRYSLGGMGLWLGIVVALSFVASWLPANRAAGMSVRESLAYE